MNVRMIACLQRIDERFKRFDIHNGFSGGFTGRLPVFGNDDPLDPRPTPP